MAVSKLGHLLKDESIGGDERDVVSVVTDDLGETSLPQLYQLVWSELTFTLVEEPEVCIRWEEKEMFEATLRYVSAVFC